MKDLKLRIQTVKASRRGRGGVQSVLIILIVFALGFYIGRSTGDGGIKGVFSTQKVSSSSGSQYGVETGDGGAGNYTVNPAGDKTQGRKIAGYKRVGQKAERKTGADKKTLLPEVVAKGTETASTSGQTSLAGLPGFPVGMRSVQYTIQISAFKRADLARKYVEELRERGYDAYVNPVLNSKDETWHLVKVGTFASAEEAWDFAAIFQQSESTSAYVEVIGDPIVDFEIETETR